MFFQIDLEKILAHQRELFFLDQMYRALVFIEELVIKFRGVGTCVRVGGQDQKWGGVNASTFRKFHIVMDVVSRNLPYTPEPGTSGLEKTAPPGELEFSSTLNQKNICNLQMFFQFDLEKNSSSLEGAVFSRPDVPGSGVDPQG